MILELIFTEEDYSDPIEIISKIGGIYNPDDSLEDQYKYRWSLIQGALLYEKYKYTDERMAKYPFAEALEKASQETLKLLAIMEDEHPHLKDLEIEEELREKLNL